jgi:hypothetical protein
MKISIHPHAILGVIAGIAGYIVTNAPVISPTIPLSYEHAFGIIVGVSGLIVTLFSQPPKKVV